jgi:hypothetical protein
MTAKTRRRIAAEAFGTFASVFAGTGAIVINEASGGAITHVGRAITFRCVQVPGCCGGAAKGACS